MEFKYLRINVENGIAILTLSRPEALNALNKGMLQELNGAIHMLEVNQDVDILVITGEGKSFVAGADISEMAEYSPKEAREYGFLGQNVFRKLEKLSKPTIAAINGYALGGGCELALACDLRIASNKAKFGQPEVSLGITPGFSGTQRLPKIVGLAKAKELIFTGKIITADESFGIGLVDKVVSNEELMSEVLELANSILINGQLAVRSAKKAIDEGYNESIDIGNKYELNYFSKCFETFDQKEGMKAFSEKRKPEFKSK